MYNRRWTILTDLLLIELIFLEMNLFCVRQTMENSNWNKKRVKYERHTCMAKIQQKIREKRKTKKKLTKPHNIVIDAFEFITRISYMSCYVFPKSKMEYCLAKPQSMHKILPISSCCVKTSRTQNAYINLWPNCILIKCYTHIRCTHSPSNFGLMIISWSKNILKCCKIKRSGECERIKPPTYWL